MDSGLPDPALTINFIKNENLSLILKVEWCLSPKSKPEAGFTEEGPASLSILYILETTSKPAA